MRVGAQVSAHSHAFQVALRGVAERPSGPEDDFWSWREAMFALAGSLTPDTIHALARRAYGEMRAAGYGAVGEFHYVHHQPDGTPYAEPNALAHAVAEAARAEGLRIVLLPAAYHRNGHEGVLAPGQRRFVDPDVGTFLARVDALRDWARDRPGVEVGVAAHSVRAVPADWLGAIAAWSEGNGAVRHVHAAEQTRELAECEAEHGCSPIELLHRTGFLGARASVVHAVHVDAADVGRLAAGGATVVSCPTTEGNLGDGHPRALDLFDAGVPLAVGSDQNGVLDPLAELRELETLARRERRTRHALLARTGDLWTSVRVAGLRSLGLDDAGTVEVVRDHPSLAGVQDGDVAAALVTCAAPGALRPA